MRASILAGCVTLAACASAQSAVVLQPLTSFGTNGWLAPGSRTYLTSDNTQRGIAYNPVTNNVYVANRAGGISLNILNGATGADGGAVSVAGVTGGTFALNMVGVDAAGVIYASNLTTDATASPYKVYRWDNEAATATVAYSGAPLAGARFGDTLDVRGSTTNTQISAGINNAPAVAGNNGYGLLTTADGTNFTGTSVGFVGTPPNAGDHRLGITFIDSSRMIGTQGGTSNPARVSTFSGSSGTLTNSPLLTTTTERPMDFATVFGIPMLATLDTGSSIVRLYDMSDLDSPLLLTSLTTITGTSVANANGVGAVAWGTIGAESATLYALNTNNGVQAFEVLIPEPASLGLVGLAGTMLLGRRRR